MTLKLPCVLYTCTLILPMTRRPQSTCALYTSVHYNRDNMVCYTGTIIYICHILHDAHKKCPPLSGVLLFQLCHVAHVALKTLFFKLLSFYIYHIYSSKYWVIGITSYSLDRQSTLSNFCIKIWRSTNWAYRNWDVSLCACQTCS